MKNLFYAARPIVSDMLSTILFAALFALTNNIYLSTGFAVALGVGQVAYEKLRGKPVPGMQWASLGLVTVLGGATLMTGDPRFVMIKPTVIYLTIGAAMMQPGWMERYMPPEGRAYIPARVIVAWGYVWAGLMFLTAAANLVIAVAMGHQAWALFVGAFPLASKLVLFAINYLSIRHVALRNVRAQEEGVAGEAEAQAA
ncbi:MAG: intracellular septation protein [Caulobacteraceae bacterium]|nr:intracellular septation protein [Caulobacteraceae bacterium]